MSSHQDSKSLDNYRLAVIVAVAENGVIGRNGDLPWRLSADLRRFRRLTMGHHVIMGRKTYESLPGPLPGRQLIVLSRRQLDLPEDVQLASDLATAIDLCGDDDLIFVIGGASVFAEALPLADELDVTVVHADVAGDTYFPKVDWSDWQLIEDCWHAADERNEYAFSFRRYEKVPPHRK